MSKHPNAQQIERLYAALQRHDAAAMAECYGEGEILFRDIAFRIKDKPQLYGMWRMICEGESNLTVDVKHVEADDQVGEARIVDDYWFGRNTQEKEPGKHVINPITSRFRFRGGKIVEHIDDCDQKAWAGQAIGGPLGWLAGRIRLLRSFKANKKLKRFLKEHPVPAAVSHPAQGS